MIDMFRLKGANGPGVHAAGTPRVTLCGKMPFLIHPEEKRGMIFIFLSHLQPNYLTVVTAGWPRTSFE